MSGMLRSPWTFETAYAQDVYANLGELATDPQALYKQLHALALSMYQVKQRIQGHEAAGHVELVRAELKTLVYLRDLFADTARRFEATGNDEGLNIAEQVLLSSGTYIDSVLKALPGAVIAIPSAFIQATGQLLTKAGGIALGAALPWGLLAVGAVALLLYAERSSTVRMLSTRGLVR